MRAATVRGVDDEGPVSFAVQVAGPCEGPPLLLLPGQANSHDWWRLVRAGFEDVYRTVTFDYRGTGATRCAVGDWSTRSFAADAAHVMASLGLPRYRVYGTSMGGRIAQHLAARHPERVERLVLACTSPGGPHARERSAQVRRLLASPPSPERTATVVGYFYTPAWPGQAEDSPLLGDRTMTAEASVAHLRASNRHDAWDALPDITAPTLILHGTDDLMVPADNASVLAARILDARVHLHEGGRHGFFEEFREQLGPLIRDALA